MTAADIRQQFPAWSPFLPAEDAYALVEWAWLRDVFYPRFRAERQRLGASTYARRNDCDDFARAYAQLCQDCWANTPGDEPEAAVAVGEFWYVSRSGPHAINVAFTDQGKIYIEPQTGLRLALTPQEELSCIAVRF
jgi:hypothetical protein